MVVAFITVIKAEASHFVKSTNILLSPLRNIVMLDIVLIVLKKLLIAAFGYAKQLYLYFK